MSTSKTTSIKFYNESLVEVKARGSLAIFGKKIKLNTLSIAGYLGLAVAGVVPKRFE